jgi:hypothetical protein
VAVLVIAVASAIVEVLVIVVALKRGPGLVIVVLHQ